MRVFFTISILFCSFWLVAQNSFIPLNGTLGGSIRTIKRDPVSGRLYAMSEFESMGWISDDNGATWKDLGSSFYSVVLDGNKIYATDYDAFYVSEDGGANWVRRGDQAGFINGLYLIKLPVPGEVFVTYGCEGVFLSADGGVNWKKLSTASGCVPGDYKVAYTSTGDLYFVSADTGLMRHKVPTDGVWDAAKVTTVFPKEFPNADAHVSIGINASNKVYFISARTDGTVNTIKTSTTGNSGSWTVVTGPGSALHIPVWTLSPSGKLFLADNSNHTFWELSNESTFSWTSKKFPNAAFSDYNVLSFAWKSNTELYAGTNGSGVFYSGTTATTNWTELNGVFPNAIVSPYASDIEILSDGTLITKDDHGTKGVWTSSDHENFTWRPQAFTIFGARPQQKLIKLQDNSILVASSDGTLRTTDGISWTQQNASGYGVYIPVGTNSIYGFREDGTAGVSTNIGVTWTNITVNGLPSSLNIMYGVHWSGNFFLAIQNHGSGKTEYWKIDTSTTTWSATKLSIPLRSDPWSCAGFFELNNKLYAGDNRMIAISPDQGANWSSIQYDHETLMPIRQGDGAFGLGLRGSLLVTQDDGQSWRNIAAPNSWAVIKDIAQLGNEFYAVFQGGAVSRFSGNLVLSPDELPPVINFAWQPLPGGPFGGSGNKIVRNSSGQMFAIGNNGLFRYNDIAARWDHIIVPQLYYGTVDIFINSTGKVYLTDGYQFFYSTDAGNTWKTSITRLASIRKIGVSVSGDIILTSGAGLYRSTDGGVSFSKPTSAALGDFRQIGTSSSGTLLVSKTENSSTTLWKSSDNGATWAQISGVDLSSNKEVLSIRPLEAGALSVVTTDNIYKTSDGGNNWISIRGDLASIFNDHYWRENSKVFVGQNNNYYYIDQSALYSSSDGGTHWIKTFDYPTVSHVIWNGDKIYASGTGDGIHVFADGVLSAFNKGYSSFIGSSLVLSGSKILYCGGIGGKVFMSSDGGVNFSLVETGNYADKLLKLSSGKLLAYGSGVSQSLDNGDSWTHLGHTPSFLSRIFTADEEIFFGQSDQKFLRSTDLINWTEIAVTGLPSSFYVESVAADNSGAFYFTCYNNLAARNELYKVEFGNAVLVEDVPQAGTVMFSNNLIYAYARNGVMFDTSDGITWNRTGAAPSGNSLMITENNYFFISNEVTGNLWLSRDEGDSWQNVGGFASDIFQNIQIDLTTGYAYANIENRVVHKSSSVIIPDDHAAPALSGLDPFNTQDNVPLDVEFSLTFSEAVKGVAGKKVRLFDASQPATALQIFESGAGTFINNNKIVSFAPNPVNIAYGKSYFIVVDNGAFTDIFGNAFTGIATSTSWAFTVLEEPDTEAPQFPVAFTPTPLDKSSASAKVFETEIRDKALVPNKINFLYRPINSREDAPFTAVKMNEGSAPNKFMVTVQSGWYAEVGLEFYFQAEDVSGNIGRDPQDSDYYYSYIKYSNDTKPKITGLTFGQEEANYRIIAIPYDVVDNNIATIFDEKGSPDKEQWRMATYAGDNRYDEYPEKLSAISRGKGYWFLQRSFADVAIENASIASNNRNDLFKLTLQPGWNQIGNPYPFPIRWAAVLESNPGKSFGEFKRFLNGAYSNTGEIEIAAYEGGWVKNEGPNPIEINISFGSFDGGRKASTDSDLDGDSWEVPLIITQGQRSNNIGGVGMHPEASAHSDRFDDFNPPAFVSRFELQFSVQDPKAGLAKSVVPTVENYEWSFHAFTTDDEWAELSWDNSQFGKSNKELCLLDESSQAVVDMRSESAYRFRGRRETSFRIYFGENVRNHIKPAASVLGDPYPNPSSGKTIIPFSVSENVSGSIIRVDIFNVHGKRIKTLINRTLVSGLHSVEWANVNEEVPAGLYICYFTGADVSGNRAIQVKKITVKK